VLQAFIDFLMNWLNWDWRSR